MKELVVISGKGGTGKTSIVGSFAALARKCVLADCDVDAADLHLLLTPKIIESHEFRSGHEAVIRQGDCTGCGECFEHCRFDAIRKTFPEGISASRGAWPECKNCTYCVRSCSIQADIMIRQMQEEMDQSRPVVYAVDPVSCEGCGVCVRLCPAHAIDFNERVCGEWMISETRYGPMVHARLGAAAENSGKLVTLVRQQAKAIAEKNNLDMIIVDGSPGTGCPVIASLTGADLLLIVTEPTLSGLHDLERVIGLARHFSMPSVVCINKWDINPEIADEIEQAAVSHGSEVVGKIRYDNEVTKAQIMNASIIEYSSGMIAQEIESLWRHVIYELG